MKKRIALFTTSNGNMGDSVHAAGSTYVLHKVFPPSKYKYHIFIQNRDCYYYDLLRSDYDYIIFAGAPYLFHNFWDTYKYGLEVRDLIKRNKKAVKIALGIGSVFSLDTSINKITKSKSFVKELQNFYDTFSLIVVRDRFAQKLFSKSNIKAHLLPCPSCFFFYRYPKPSFNRNRKPLVIIGNPDIISPELTTQEQKDKIVRMQSNIVESCRSPLIASVCFQGYGVLNGFSSLAKDHVRYIQRINNRIDLIRLLSKASIVYSTRLHVAVPASLLGIPTYLIPFDTRAYCANLFNIKVLSTIKDKKPYRVRNIDWDKCLQQYIKLLKGAKNE